MQRYDVNLSPVSGDQATAVNDLVTAGSRITPAIAGSAAAGGSFVAAWLDSLTGDVRGAVLGGTSGYLFDPIDGNATEFKASIARTPRARTRSSRSAARARGSPSAGTTAPRSTHVGSRPRRSERGVREPPCARRERPALQGGGACGAGPLARLADIRDRPNDFHERLALVGASDR